MNGENNNDAYVPSNANHLQLAPTISLAQLGEYQRKIISQHSSRNCRNFTSNSPFRSRCIKERIFFTKWLTLIMISCEFVLILFLFMISETFFFLVFVHVVIFNSWKIFFVEEIIYISHNGNEIRFLKCNGSLHMENIFLLMHINVNTKKKIWRRYFQYDLDAASDLKKSIFEAKNYFKSVFLLKNIWFEKVNIFLCE